MRISINSLFSYNALNKFLIFFFPILVFIYFYDYSILLPWNTKWLMGGDLGANFIGWHAFRYDEWRLPVTETKLLAWPHGVPIVFTDSNPLLAVIFKVMSSILPREFQYIGFWYLICLILQSLAGFCIGHRISKSYFYGSLIALFLCMYPP